MNKNAPPFRLNSGGNAVVMGSHDHNENTTRKQYSLTSESTRAFIAQTAKRRDEAQIGMTRKEVIRLMMHLTGGTSDQCENHYDYLISRKKMPELKNHGRVQRAQQTTTKRSCIRIEQQFRWHMTIETIWEDHRRFNQPTEEYVKLQPHFQINLDETGVLGSTGILRVVGSAEVKKHEKNTQDNRDSITIVRIGNAAGNSGLWFFLIKQKELERDSPLHNLSRNFPGVPPGSKVICTDNAYMTDATWIKLAPDIAKGIRMMPVIKDHPEWKVVVTLDGFSSHLVPAGLEPFTNALIEVVKEEGDTSQVNQAYDQSVAKEDKKVIGTALDLVRSTRKLAVFNQETLVAVCIHALRNINPTSWVSSFRKVNQHPHHRIDFEAWCKKIESKLVTGEQFFKNRVGLFDAMPSFWKQMTCQDRHEVVGMIDGFYSSANQNGETNSSPWTIENVCKLVKYVALDDINQLRGCYLTTKIDPSVFVEPCRAAEIAADAAEAQKLNETLHLFTWKPKVFVDAINRETTRNENGHLIGPCGAASQNTANSYLTHITNFVAGQHANATKGRKFLEPSSFLNVEVTDDQRYLLQPTASDVLVGNILEDSVGQNAKKKIPKRRINMIAGNISSYSRVLNNQKSLDYISEANLLSSCISEISVAKEIAKDAAKEKREQEQKSREGKKAGDRAAFEKKKAELCEELENDLMIIDGLGKGKLLNLLKYYFEDKTPNKSKKSREDLVVMVQLALNERNAGTLGC